MMGTGTNAAAAFSLKRRFVGIEKEPDRYALARSQVIRAQKVAITNSRIES